MDAEDILSAIMAPLDLARGQNNVPEKMMRGLDVVGNATHAIPGLPDYDPKIFRDNLNRLRTAANIDPGSFAQQVMGYAGDTLSSPYVSLATGGAAGAGGAATRAAMASALSNVGSQQLLGNMAREFGGRELSRVGAGTKDTPKNVDEYRAAVEKGEPIGPKYTLQEAIARSRDDGTSIRMRGNDVLPGDLDKTKGVSKYKQSGAYARLLNPGGEAAAQQMYLQAKNDVYARYKDAMKAAANNPSALKAIMEEVEKRASADALKTIPREYRDSIVATATPAQEVDQETETEKPGFLATYGKPIAATAGATLLAYLIARKLITPQQAEKLAESGAVPQVADKFAGLSRNVIGSGSADDAIQMVANASKSNLGGLTSKITEQAAPLGLPGPQGKIPYIPYPRSPTPPKLPPNVERIIRMMSPMASNLSRG